MKGNPSLLKKDGLPLLTLPITKRDKTNEKRREVYNLQDITAAEMVHKSCLSLNAPMLLCGQQKKLKPFLSLFTKMDSRFVLVGTPDDFFSNDSCLGNLPYDWEAQQPDADLPEGSGRMILESGAETTLSLKAFLSGWKSHLLIICLGNGLTLDNNLLNLLNGLGRYVLVTNSLPRSVIDPLEVKILLAHMNYIVVSSIGSSADDLLSVLPDYEAEIVTNTTDLSLHQDSPIQEAGGHHRLHGLGGRISQSRTQGTKSILSQAELTSLQKNNMVLVYNNRTRDTWVGQVVH